MINFPPRDETLAMYATLESLYFNQGYPARVTYVDAEGTAVWLQQYLLYRVNGLSHSEAEAKVLRDIDQIWHPPPPTPGRKGIVRGNGRVFEDDGES